MKNKFILLLSFCIFINVIIVFADLPENLEFQGEEELNITLDGSESVNRLTYKINGELFLVDIFEFQSTTTVDEMINNYGLELDMHRIDFNNSTILYYDNYIEWFSGEYFISIKHDTSFEPNIIVSYYLNEFPSSLSLPSKDIGRMQTLSTIASASSDCKCGFLNICAFTEHCWIKGDECYVSIVGCYDGSGLTSGDGDWCKYKSQVPHTTESPFISTATGCGYNEGDCDFDSECENGLHCSGPLGGDGNDICCKPYESNDISPNGSMRCGTDCATCGDEWWDFKICDPIECLNIGEECYFGNWLAPFLGCYYGPELENGDWDYCRYLSQQQDGCSRNGYDCEEGECSNDLYCDHETSLFDFLYSDGCCEQYENWNPEENFCNWAVKGRIYEVNNAGTSKLQDIPFGNLKLEVYITANNQWPIPDISLGSFIVDVDSNGYFKFNPERYFDWWDDLSPLVKYRIQKIEAIQGNEVIASWSNQYSNDFNYRAARDYVDQVVRIHTDMLSWEEKTQPLVQSLTTTKVQEIPKIFSTTNSQVDSMTYASVFWNGTLKVPDSGKYIFGSSIAGGLILIINNEKILDFWEGNPEGLIINNSIELKEGYANVTIYLYKSLEDKGDMLLWNTPADSELKLLSEEYLKVIDVETEFTSEPLRPILTRAFSTQASISYVDEEKDYMVSVVEKPESKTSSKEPLLMVHGLHGESGYWSDIPLKLKNRGYDVWQFYYPNNDNNSYSAALLADAIDYILGNEYSGKSKVDVVSHSMGGLVTRGYINGLANLQDGTNIGYDGNINRYVVIATPHYGSHFSNLVLSGKESLPFLIRWLYPEDPDAPAYKDLAVGSWYTWKLNYNAPVTPIKYLAVAGDKDFNWMEDKYSDGLVSLGSASLLNHNMDLVIVNQNHANQIGRTILDEFFDIGYDTTKMVNIIDYFFEGKEQDIDEDLLNPFEYYVTGENVYGTPYQRGNVLINLADDGQINTLILMNDENKSYYLVKNELTGIWYRYDNGFGGIIECGEQLLLGYLDIVPITTLLECGSGLLNLVNITGNETSEFNTFCSCLDPILISNGVPISCSAVVECYNGILEFSDRGLSLKTGNYTLIADGIEYYEKLNIKPSTTNMFELRLNSCEDGVQNGDETGIDCGGNCMTEDEEFCNGKDDDQDCEIDEDISSRICSLNYLGNCAIGTERCISGEWVGCPQPGIEECDGIDQDCDGILDGSEVLTQQCGTSNLGICTFGIETCDDFGNWENCDAVFPEVEICENGIDEDCDGIDNPCFETPIIHNPKDDDVISDRKVLINISVGKEVKYIKYQLDGKISRNGEPMYITLCRDCEKVEKYISMIDGFHTMGVITINEDNRQYEDSVKFIVDDKEPKISKTEPRRGYANGNFYVEFKEENPINITLHYGNSVREQPINPDDCYPIGGGKIGCNVYADVEDFDGHEIEYWFTIEDISGNLDESRHEELMVDTSNPLINGFDYYIDGRYVTFTLDITEKNLDEIEYMDLNDDRARWRTLCRRLDGNICEKRVSFKDGQHNVIINITDEAGNYNSTNVTFFTDSKDPRISKTEPRRGYADGNFYVEFREDNPLSIFLNYGNEKEGYGFSEVDLDSCQEERGGYSCAVYADLENYNTQEIEYWFNITDLIGNKDESRPYSLSVDTVPPEIGDHWVDVDGRYATFYIEIDELNFDEASYIDAAEGDRARYRRLCSRLDDGVCEDRNYFRSGDHEITILILDEAGNNATIEGITFTT